MTINTLIRPNIAALQAYSSARTEFSQGAERQLIFLDANENSLGSPAGEAWMRYPDPRQTLLRQKIAALKGCAAEQVFTGNGSDEALDLLFRIFCNPGNDNVLALKPSYGMYRVLAQLHGVELREIALDSGFQPKADVVLSAVDERSKILFLCSPNNPSGQCLPAAFVEQMLVEFPGIVALDEAYIDFASSPSWLDRLDKFPRLVILQTFSKAWGLAGLRLGMAYAQSPVIELFDKVKYPYNLNAITPEVALRAMEQAALLQVNIQLVCAERERLAASLRQMPFVKSVFPSDANFLLFRCTDAADLYAYLLRAGIVVRNRSREYHCENCLRITVGKPEENTQLIAAMIAYAEQIQKSSSPFT